MDLQVLSFCYFAITAHHPAACKDEGYDDRTPAVQAAPAFANRQSYLVVCKLKDLLPGSQPCKVPQLLPVVNVVGLSVGVKNLLAGNQQAAVTVAVEGLMDAKANAEPDSFVTFDPKVS